MPRVFSFPILAMRKCAPPDGLALCLGGDLSARLDRDGESEELVVHADEWELAQYPLDDGRMVHLLHHTPSHCVFAVDMVGPEPINAFSLRASLAYVCKGHEPPPPERVRRLGKEGLLHFHMQVASGTI